MYGSGVISCVKELPSQSPTFQGQLRSLSFVKYLVTAEDRRMVGFISTRSKPTTMDGPMDVPTLTVVPMRELILGTLFRTLGDD